MLTEEQIDELRVGDVVRVWEGQWDVGTIRCTNVLAHRVKLLGDGAEAAADEEKRDDDEEGKQAEDGDHAGGNVGAALLQQQQAMLAARGSLG